MKNQLKNIATWVIPILTSFCSIVYMDLALQNKENNLASFDKETTKSEVTVAAAKDKKSVTQNE